MRRKSFSTMALLMLLALGLVPALHANAQSRKSNATTAAQEAAVVEIVTFNCAAEPLLDGSLATEPPKDCADEVFLYSGTIVDSTGIIVTSHMAALAEPGESHKLGWQLIGF